MPSKSAKQAKFMRAVAHGWRPTRTKAPPVSVAKEFVEADKRANMYEGGLAPMNDIMQRGFAPELGALEQAFAKGGEVPGFAFGGSSWVGNWGSRQNKNLRLLDLMAPWREDTRKVGKKERKRRARAERKQERGAYGEEVLTNVKNPRRRRALVRAGWIAETPSENRKGVQGAKGKKGKKYDVSLNRDTVFYPPESVGIGPGGAGPTGEYLANLRPGLTGGQAYVPPTDIYSTYIAAPGGAEGGAVGYQEGGSVRTWDDIPGKTMIAKAVNAMRMKSEGWVPSEFGEGVDLKSIVWYPPEQTILSDTTDDTTGGLTPAIRGPGRRGGRRGGRGGRRRNGGGEPPLPRDIPGALPPGRPPGGDLVPPTGAPPVTPIDPRAGRDTPYSQALRAHRARVAASLGVPAGGYAGGGAVTGYQEGGAARPGHAEGPNPYPEGSARWKLWERKHHIDPAPPPEPEAEAEEEERGWLSRLLGVETERQTRTERELEELEEARGGYIQNYQTGGLATAMGAAMDRYRGAPGMGVARNRFRAPPRGGVPPTIQSMMRRRMGGIPPRVDPRRMATTQPVGPMQTTTGGPGRPWRGAPPPMARRLPIKPAGYDPRGGPITPPPGKETGLPGGGPQIPPNLRGYLQRARMMGRARRGIPGPAGAGGAPQNRVGQMDQQGGLSRALQRGTGRPPMSRRQGFYR